MNGGILFFTLTVNINICSNGTVQFIYTKCRLIHIICYTIVFTSKLLSDGRVYELVDTRLITA